MLKNLVFFFVSYLSEKEEKTSKKRRGTSVIDLFTVDWFVYERNGERKEMREKEVLGLSLLHSPLVYERWGKTYWTLIRGL